MKAIIGLLSLLILLCSPRSVFSASVPAIEFDGRQLGGTIRLPDTTTGWEFTPLTDIVVDKLGLYDDHSIGGFVQAHSIGLWRADGTWITQVEVPSGEVRPLEGNFRYVDVVPGIRLTAYVPYVIGAFYADGSDRTTSFWGPTLPLVRVDPNIRWDAFREASFNTFHCPGFREPSGGIGLFGPSFTFVPLAPNSGDLRVETRFLNGDYGLVDEPMDFSVTITNRGSISASNVTVRITNSLPGGLPFERISSSQGACQIESGSLVCDLGNLASNTSASVLFGSTATSSVVFVSTVSSDTPDPLPANNSATNRVTVYAAHPFDVSGPVSKFEGEPVRFHLSLSATLSSPFTVSFSTVDNTAMAGQDYNDTNGSITFAPGETMKTIDVSIVKDQVLEPDESFALQVFAPRYANPFVRSVAIVDNDWPSAPYSEGFEEGVLPQTHWIPNSTPSGLFVASSGQPHGGTNELVLAPSTFTFGQVSANLRLNVGSQTNLALSFWARYGPGSPTSWGIGDVGVAISVDGGATFHSIENAISPLAPTHTRCVVELDPIFAQYPLNSSGILGIRFFNNLRYYPPFLDHPAVVYDHRLILDDIQVSGSVEDVIVTLTQLQTQGGFLRFSFLADLGWAYRVEYKDDLAEMQWHYFQTVSGDGLIKTIAVPLGPQSKRFYRVRRP